MKPVRIVLCSDNHGDRESISFIRREYADFDYLIHCGDSEMMTEELDGFLCVQGNHDYSKHPDHQILTIGDHRIYICHGHMDFYRYFKYNPMIENAKKNHCDTVFFGHVHTYQDTVQQGIRLLNPGSLYHNRDATKPSYMLVTIDDEGIHAERRDYIKVKKEVKKKEPGWFTRWIKKFFEEDNK